MNKGEQTRRGFFKAVIGLTLTGGALLWGKMMKTNEKVHKQTSVVIPVEPNNKVIFADDYIVVNDNDKISVFSSRCTHLGCRINETSNDFLLCPCHGSRYNMQGVPVEGPALSPLEKLDFELNKEGTQLTVRL